MSKQRLRTLTGAGLLSGAILIRTPAAMGSAGPLDRIPHTYTHGSVAAMWAHDSAAMGGYGAGHHSTPPMGLYVGAAAN